jgi:NifU-like protein involved in Fe-S cluster formation
VAPAHFPAYIAPVPSPLYNRDILRLAVSIPHLGRLEAPQARVELASPVCGSRVTVDVRLDEQGRVAEMAQEVRACALGQASAALMGSHVIGKSPEELAAARDVLANYLSSASEEPGDWPGLVALAPARPYSARHASILLPFEAVAEAARQASQTLPVSG